MTKFTVNTIWLSRGGCGLEFDDCFTVRNLHPAFLPTQQQAAALSQAHGLAASSAAAMLR